ncbi:MAG: hypothetical protein ACYTFI_26900, partial [Planctomycetota bacterium]
EEILRIQKMVAEGKVTPEDSVELIEALGRSQPVEPSHEAPLTKAGAARWSFYLAIATAVCCTVGPIADEAGPRSAFASVIAGLCLVGALACLVVGFALGRLALAAGPLPGRKLAGWRRIQASVMPVFVSFHILSALLVGWPVLGFFLVEDPFLDGGTVFLGEVYVGTDPLLWTSVSAAMFALTWGVAAVVVARWTGLARAVCRPMLEWLKPRHWKWLFGAVAAGVVVSALFFGLYLKFRPTGVNPYRHLDGRASTRLHRGDFFCPECEKIRFKEESRLHRLDAEKRRRQAEIRFKEERRLRRLDEEKLRRQKDLNGVGR